jgi:phage gp16-like protein
MNLSPTDAGLSSAERRRKRDLAKIHVAKKQLGLDDDSYRQIILRLTGGIHDSAAPLNVAQRRLLLAEFQRLGWKPQAKTEATTSLPVIARQSAQKMLWKIGQLLGERGWPYADGMVRHMFQIDSVRFATDQQLHKLIAALEIDQKRRQR